MAIRPNRSDFQELAKLRLKDAKALLDSGHASGAYYLCGYVIECALKACIAKQTKEYDFPPERKTVEQIYTHDLKTLRKSALPDEEFNKEYQNDGDFARNWKTVILWNEHSRYQTHDTGARKLFEAVTDPKHGVLQWIERHW
ncbi:MAG: HEPN domain-containing protein [Pseudomonadota bacterium]